MTDKPDAWMPLYIGDWDSGTRHLDCEQDGAYGRLVRHYWKNGALTDDDAQLARVVGMGLPRWRKIRPIIAAFFTVADGKWTHGRVERELVAWTERKRRATERASAGGRAKAAKNPASSTQQAVLEQCSSSSPLEEEGSKKPSSLQRRPRGRAPDEARPLVAWTGPDDLRAAVVVAKGENFARAYLDPCAWQDLPVRGMAAATRVAERKLSQEVGEILIDFNAQLLTEPKESVA